MGRNSVAKDLNTAIGAVGPADSSDSVATALEASERKDALSKALSPEEVKIRTAAYIVAKNKARLILNKIEELSIELEELGYDVKIEKSSKGDLRLLHHSAKLSIVMSVIDPEMSPNDDMGKHINSLDFAGPSIGVGF